MNKYIFPIAFFLTLVLGACEKDLEVYHHEQEWLAFRFHENQDSITYKTFIYDQEEVTCDTIYVDLHLIGYLTDYDRPVSVEQVPIEGERNAVAGVHYVDFNSEAWKPNMVIRANDGEPKLPIALLRDTSLASSEYFLRLKIVGNEYFQPWSDTTIYKTISITDQLTKPEKWIELYFGVWGPVKHRFLIDTFEAIAWDDEFFEVLSQDYPYCEYLQEKAQEALDEENQRRSEQNPPLGPLTEKGGTEVKFIDNH